MEGLMSVVGGEEVWGRPLSTSLLTENTMIPAAVDMVVR